MTDQNKTMTARLAWELETMITVFGDTQDEALALVVQNARSALAVYKHNERVYIAPKARNEAVIDPAFASNDGQAGFLCCHAYLYAQIPGKTFGPIVRWVMDSGSDALKVAQGRDARSHWFDLNPAEREQLLLKIKNDMALDRLTLATTLEKEVPEWVNADIRSQLILPYKVVDRFRNEPHIEFFEPVGEDPSKAIAAALMLAKYENTCVVVRVSENLHLRVTASDDPVSLAQTWIALAQEEASQQIKSFDRDHS